MTGDVNKWMNFDGINFLKKIGIREGMQVLDYGCGEGHYTIPLSKVVGNKGIVYALDKNPEVLKFVSTLIREMKTDNIQLIKSDTTVPINDDSLDFALVYDVIHYVDRRDKIYREVKRVLKSRGIFSLYPKHNKNDYPLMELANISLKEIIDEIEKFGFTLKETIDTTCLHDTYYNQCQILNFFADK
ncbi:MAG: hypothetical protein DRP91_08995 [Candidatus Neomarinimicrobiota bacterium]|nr:class I SAM-dependent methyltransferase [Candidatus Neomarinimicrobiota bacterium]RKY46596.1 MAG: hypothetical protein DRP91_08995 [Candidatus Neomarinimicrobiota bacterium]